MNRSTLKIALLIFALCSLAHADDPGSQWKWSKYGLSPTDNPCAIPVPCTGWQKRLFDQRKRTNFHQWGLNAIFLGDSITHHWNANPKVRNGSKVRKAFMKTHKQIHFWSFGVAGDEPQNLLWLITEGDIMKGINPKVITVMIGINSLNRKKTPEQVACGIKSILTVLRKTKPHSKILLLGIWPCWNPTHPVRAKVAKTNKLISAFADSETIHFLDIGHAFVDDKGNMKRELIYDGIHPSEKGYQRWAELMFPKIAEMMK